MVEKERLLKVKRMTTSETRTVSTQDKLAVWLLCVRDAPVIEMIAKPALPIWFGDTACKRCEMHLVRIDALLGIDLTTPCNT